MGTRAGVVGGERWEGVGRGLEREKVMGDIDRQGWGGGYGRNLGLGRSLAEGREGSAEGVWGTEQGGGGGRNGRRGK